MQQQKFDDNGELILVEGICWCEGVKTFSFLQKQYIDIEIRKGTPNAVKCCWWDLSTVDFELNTVIMLMSLLKL